MQRLKMKIEIIPNERNFHSSLKSIKQFSQAKGGDFCISLTGD
jgi:hypothetical protein